MTVSRMLTDEEVAAQVDRSFRVAHVALLRLRARILRDIRRLDGGDHAEWQDYGQGDA